MAQGAEIKDEEWDGNYNVYLAKCKDGDLRPLEFEPWKENCEKIRELWKGTQFWMCTCEYGFQNCDCDGGSES